jgi:hypothetical protein
MPRLMKRYPGLLKFLMNGPCKSDESLKTRLNTPVSEKFFCLAGGVAPPKDALNSDGSFNQARPWFGPGTGRQVSQVMVSR